MKNLGLILLFTAILVGSVSMGCAAPETSDEQPNGRWTDFGKSTGFDKKAKDIEGRLGYK